MLPNHALFKLMLFFVWHGILFLGVSIWYFKTKQTKTLEYTVDYPPRIETIHDNCKHQTAKMQALIIQWRRVLGEHYCASHNQDGVSPSGGWCLEESQENWGDLGRSAKHHVIADDGLATTIAKYIEIKERRVSLLDIGAGVGQYGHWFHKNNISVDWRGYDGAENVESYTSGFVKWIDVTNALFDTVSDYEADWVLSLEIAEHIPSVFTDNYLKLLARHSKIGIIISWGVPGQSGHSHINCRSNEDVVSLMKKHNFTQDEWCMQFQMEGRQRSNYGWFKGSFMVFKRYGTDLK